MDVALLALTKRLIRMPETVAIHQRDTRFRDWLKTIATPFRGLWLVPGGMIERTDAALEVWRNDREQLVEIAGDAYLQHLDEMRAPDKLGPLFNPLDYPPKEVFKARFSIWWRFVDFGVPTVLREVRADVFERERQKLESEGMRARTMIEQHLAGALLKITDHLAKLLQPRANGRRAALREGALDDLLAFLDTIALRDVTGFQELQAVTDRLRATAQGLSVEDLRTDQTLRERTAATIEEARDAVSALVITDDALRTIRIRDEEE